MTSCPPICPNSRATPQRYLHCSLPAMEGLVIRMTLRRSFYARPVIVRGQQCTGGAVRPIPWTMMLSDPASNPPATKPRIATVLHRVASMPFRPNWS
jgi:hypothetical protein